MLSVQVPARAEYIERRNEHMCDDLSIKSAAKSALRNLGRTSFSDEGFTSQQIDAIAQAIADAVQEYDKQVHSSES